MTVSLCANDSETKGRMNRFSASHVGRIGEGLDKRFLHWVVRNRHPAVTTSWLGPLSGIPSLDKVQMKGYLRGPPGGDRI